MEQEVMKKFNVIGRCSKMQTFTLEQVCELIDGVPYDIDLRPVQIHLDQDWNPIENMSTPSIMSLLLAPPKVAALPTRNEPHWTEKDWKRIDKQVKKNAELEEGDTKKVSPKKAMKKYNRALKKLGVKD